ncbi:ubiquinol-cytochrome c reductase iron-sulfur subunit [Methylomarinovum caldicuralii]|uniref:Ubiquinol-cytochrome c reductase iron-sulfur subunit n=1 Tax=Methylomarinovum caldicuralii TaxID=438856 RepID=A0AAU9C7S6_9GAMM|nr:ubiquinol-cytochrome c reductase iron-sulfur subunit [Methylomarinovum caldicuralii]BCX81471.1 ubiquinol-cytochrome c reductase iron-sulfur subunit [Methylomarinovum caldicuralii]
MSTNDIDLEKRRFLTQTTMALGAVGAGFAAAPFISYMKPGAGAMEAAAPIDVDISKLEPGQLIRVEWRGQPVWVLNRTEEMLASLEKIEPRLRDPNSDKSVQPPYCKNRYRSIKPEVFVAVGICTHLGCSPTYRPEVAPPDLGKDWLGGFFCPCHGSGFDLAGRVFKKVPAPKNLVVPPYRYVTDTHIIVGEDQQQEAA